MRTAEITDGPRAHLLTALPRAGPPQIRKRVAHNNAAAKLLPDDDRDSLHVLARPCYRHPGALAKSARQRFKAGSAMAR
jgi:hypothetical protein